MLGLRAAERPVRRRRNMRCVVTGENLRLHDAQHSCFPAACEPILLTKSLDPLASKS
mgnify:CR=1 FL=1